MADIREIEIDDEIIEDEDPTTCVERRARGECNFDLVVRCRDCKHYLGMAECDIEGVFCGGTNFYCAYGEKKERMVCAPHIGALKFALRLAAHLTERRTTNEM